VSVELYVRWARHLTASWWHDGAVAPEDLDPLCPRLATCSARCVPTSASSMPPAGRAGRS
jgi:hypothetical protein